MKRWNNQAGDNAEFPEIDAFLLEVIEVSKRHGMSLSHEDGHGSFEIVPFDKLHSDWLLNANDARE